MVPAVGRTGLADHPHLHGVGEGRIHVSSSALPPTHGEAAGHALLLNGGVHPAAAAPQGRRYVRAVLAGQGEVHQADVHPLARLSFDDPGTVRGAASRLLRHHTGDTT